jgi:hypothetical protein
MCTEQTADVPVSGRGDVMAEPVGLRAGQRVRVIDPEDGYYLREGDVERIEGHTVLVAFDLEEPAQPFRPVQLQTAGPSRAGRGEGE